jgi:hypothetical protein
LPITEIGEKGNIGLKTVYCQAIPDVFILPCIEGGLQPCGLREQGRGDKSSDRWPVTSERGIEIYIPNFPINLSTGFSFMKRSLDKDAALYPQNEESR